MPAPTPVRRSSRLRCRSRPRCARWAPLRGVGLAFGSVGRAARGREWGIAVADGLPLSSPLASLAVASYVGDGTASRAIPLTLNEQAPVFVLVVPTNNPARIYRVNGDSTGRNTSTGSAVANSVTALNPDQLTVGAALNATGVTYDVWAITTGVITPN